MRSTFTVEEREDQIWSMKEVAIGARMTRENGMLNEVSSQISTEIIRRTDIVLERFNVVECEEGKQALEVGGPPRRWIYTEVRLKAALPSP